MIANAGKRFLSLILALVMVVSLLPMSALAAEISGSVLNGSISLVSTGTNNGMTVENDQVTLTVTATASTSCGSTTYTGNTNTLTITNNSGEDVILSFKFSSDGDVSYVQINGENSTGGSWSGTVMAGNTVTFELKCGDTENGATATLSDFRLSSVGSKMLTFLKPENGTVTVAGTALTEASREVEVDAETGVAVSASASSGYTFMAWVDAENNILSTEAATTLKPSDDATVSAVFVQDASTQGYWSANNKLFTDLNKAAEEARDSAGKLIVLLRNATLPQGEYTIHSGTTLLIPFDTNHKVYGDKPESVLNVAKESINVSAYRTLTLGSGANLIVNGTMEVSGRHSAGDGSGQKTAGSPTGPQGFVKLNDGSTITVNGKLYAWGYIYGGGQVVANSGANVYELMQITDFRGGRATVDMALGTSILGMVGGKKDEVFPFSQYYVQNIESTLRLNYGASEHALAVIRMEDEPFPTLVKFIGSSNCMFTMSSGYVTKTFQADTDRLVIEAHGDISVSSVSLPFTYMGFDISVNSGDYNLPINSNITINICSGKGTINQDIALLPGAEIRIDSGAQIEFPAGYEAYIYDSDSWKLGKFVHPASEYEAVAYTAGERKSSRVMKDAVLDINGTVTIGGALYTTNPGAAITSTGKTGRVILSAAAGTDTATKQATYSSEIAYTEIPITAAKLLNGDGSYTETEGAAANTHFGYHAVLDKWVKMPDVTVTYEGNGGAASDDATVTTVPQTVKVLDSFALLNDNTFVRPGYTLKGWNTSGDATGTHYDLGAIIPVNVELTDANLRTVIPEKLYAEWEGNTYKILVYDAADGEGAEPFITIEKKCGETIDYEAIKAQIEEEKPGYVWDRWQGTPSTTMPAGDLELTAVLKGGTYTILWVDDTDGTELKKVEGSYGVTLTSDDKTAPDLASLQEKEGYTATGWKATAPDGTEYTAAPSTMPNYNLTFTPVWTPKEYTITFDPNDGRTATQTQEVSYEVPVDLAPNTYIRTGYTFAGWSEDQNATKATYVDKGTYTHKTDGNVTLYAVWTPNTDTKYTVRHWQQTLTGGEEQNDTNFKLVNTDNETGTTGKEVTPAVKNYDGFTAPDAQTVTIAPDGSTVVDYYYTRDSYTVKLNKGSGIASVTGDGTYKYGARVTLSATVSDGYEQIRWTDAQDEQVSQGQSYSIQITGNVEYTATATPTAYTITYKDENGEPLVTNHPDNPATYTIESADIELKDPSRKGYDFKGWTYGDVTVPTKTVTITKSSMGARTFIAHWEVVEHSITYILAGGSWPVGTTPRASYTVEDTFTLANPTKEGYTFAGWTGSNGTTAQTSVTVEKGTTDALTYTANWTPNTDTKYTVNHYWQNIDNDEYTLYETKSKTGTTDAAVDAAKTYAGFTLRPVTETVKIAPDGSTVVDYYYTRNSYTVTLNKDPGIATVTGSGTYKYGQSVTISATVKAGYTWSGWTGTHNANTPEYTFTMPAGDVTDTANAAAISYNITYLLEDGSWPDGENPNQTTYTVEDTFTLTNPTKTGHTFLGWTYGDVTEPVKAVTIDEQTGALTFTAHWQVNTYRITFHANDGSANPATKTQDAKYNGVVTLAENTFERQGYKFKEWQTKDGTSYSDKQTISYTMDADLVLYAVWERDYVTYTVETYLMGTDGTYGAAASSTETKRELTETPVTVTHETKEGFTPDTENANNVLSETVAADGSLVLKVYYSRNQYTIELDEADGDDLKDITAYYEETVTLPATASKIGYTFAGWLYEGKTVTEVTVPIGGATVTAQWTPAEVNYTIETYTMDTNGAYSETADETETRKAETESTATVTPEVKTGFTVDMEKSVLSGTVAADGSLVLRVYYSRNQYTLTTKVDDVETVVGTYYYEAAVTAPTVPTKTGYTFDGWTIISGGGSYTEIPPEMPAENLTATAKWAAATVSYTVETYTMDTTGAYGEPVTSNLSALTEKKVTTETNPATGFAVDTEKSILSGTVAADGSLVLKVYYKRNPYTIKWVSGYDSTVYRTDTYLYDAAVDTTAPAAPSRENYSFNGWTITSDGDGSYESVPDTMPAENLTITAIWLPEKNTITFNTDGGSEVQAITQDFGSEIIPPANPTKLGYSFDRWEPVLPETMPENGMELKAIWTPKEYTVTFNGNGGSYTDEDGTAQTQKKIELTFDAVNKVADLGVNVFTREGYDFMGWAAAANAEKAEIRANGTYTLTTAGDNQVTLYAVWKLKEYTITFHANDDSENPEKATQTVEHKVSEQLTGSFVREGYTLTGWKDADDNAYAVNATVQLTQNVELYAVWKINKYSIKFYTDYDGTTFETVTADFKADVAIPAVTEKVGYTFTGKWSSEKGGTEATVPEKMPARNDLVFYPLYTPTTYSIQYELDGGTLKADETNPDSYTIETDDITLNNPEKTGYSFAGWIESGGTAAQETVIIRKGSTGNKEFTAQWDPNDHVITFYANNGSDETATQNVKYAVAAELMTNSFDAPTGHKFGGWATSAEAEEATYQAGQSIAVTEDTDLYAFWEKESYTITFISDETEYTSIEAVYQSPVSKPADPEKKGHDFSGWADAEGNAVTWPVSMPLDGTTLYATWTPIEYTITWIVDNAVSMTTVAYGETPAYDGVPEKADTDRYTYEFSGWEPALPEKVTGDATYTAQFEPIERSYSISFETKFGSVKTVTGTYGSPITLATLSQEGYTFGGWKTASGATYTGTYTITGNQTLHAVWTVNEYDISFVDGFGGTIVPTKKLAFGADVEVPENKPEMVGYTFDGWVWVKGESEQNVPETMPAEHVTIRATWTAVEYTITFDANGGVFGDGSTTQETSQSYNVTLNTPEKPTLEGHTFDKWVWVKADDTEASVPSKVPAENITIKATWKINTYTIQWDKDGDGNVDRIDTDVEHGTILTPPEISGNQTVSHVYIPNGWDKKIVPAAGNVTYTAQFIVSPREYAITWVVDGDEETTYVAYGAQPTHADPEKDTDEHYSYQFTGWTPKIAAVTGEARYTAQFERTPVEYHIYLQDEDGRVIDTITAGYGTDTPDIAYPVKDGYTFTGWDGEIPGTMPAENITIKATWKINQYTITFDSAGGTDVAKITQDYNTAVSAPADPVKAGYTFDGWKPALPTTMPLNGAALTAQWKINQYTITFDCASGSSVDSITRDYNADLSDIEEPVPVRDGYTFTGWDKKIPEKMPAENITITASWSPKPYTITFYTEKGAAEAYAKINANCDDPIELPEQPSKEGYNFDGWLNEGGERVTELTTMPAGGLTLCAKWNIGTYSILFDTDGGTKVEPIEAKFGTDLTEVQVEEPSKEGYTFVGWEPEIPDTMPGSTMTVKAKWKINQYSIYFNTDGGSTVGTITQNYGTAVTAPESPTKEGYTFDGWDGEIPGTMPAKNTTLTAKWKVNTYTITFNTNGGTAVESITAEYGAEVTEPEAPTKTGYTFTGWDQEFPETMPAGLTLTAQWKANLYAISWDTDGDGDVDEITEEAYDSVPEHADGVKPATAEYHYVFTKWSPKLAVVSGEATYTAQFDAVPNEYTITFDTNGGSEIPAATYAYGAKVTAPEDPTKADYTFTGWDALPETMPAKNVTVVAQWKLNEYTIRFNTNGGSSVLPITAGYGTTIYAPKNPTRNGYTFAGWKPEFPETMPSGGALLTAQWTINQYTITFNTDGGTEIAPIKQDYGTAVTAPADPTKDGYTFLGWSETIPEKMPARDMTITALWDYTYTGWKTDDKGTTYLVGGEVAYYNQWKNIDGNDYYFDTEGYIVKGIYMTWDLTDSYEASFVFDEETGIFRKDLNGIYTTGEDTYYVASGEIVNYPGLVRVVKDDGEVNYYYFGADNKAVKDGEYNVVLNNDLLPQDSYDFDENGVIAHHEDTSRNGIHEENGKKYYYIDGVKVYIGLVQIGEDYYYAGNGGEIICGRDYWVSKTNDLLEEGSYTFDENGRIVFEEPAEPKNGIYAEDGGLYYYVNDVRTYAGLIEIEDEFYYASTGGEIICGRDYFVTKTNDLLPAGNYTFDDQGRLINRYSGDVNGDGTVDEKDVSHLLWHTLFSDLYPISIDADYNEDGVVDIQDVVILLWYTLFPELYPLN